MNIWRMSLRHALSSEAIISHTQFAERGLQRMLRITASALIEALVARRQTLLRYTFRKSLGAFFMILACCTLTGPVSASETNYILVWYTAADGSSPQPVQVSSGQTATITRKAGTKVNLRIFKGTGLPASFEYVVVDQGNAKVLQKTNAANPFESFGYCDFNDAVGSQASEVWAYCHIPGSLAKILINNAVPQVVELGVTNITVNGYTNRSDMTFSVGDTVTIAGREANNGNTGASIHRVGVYLQSDSTSTNNLIASQSYSSLAALTATNFSQTYTLQPRDVGQRYFVAMADYQNAISESDDSNNTAWWGPFTVVMPSYILTPTVAPLGGGAVTRYPNQTSYDLGTQVTVTANSSPGYVFKNWTGAVSSSTNPLIVTMNGNKSLTANFELLSGSSGGIAVTVKKIDGTPYGSGAVVKLFDGNYTTLVNERTTESSSVASWTGVAPGTYNIEAWSPTSAGEYWGGQGNVSVTADQTATLTITRNEPYATVYKVYNGTSDVTGGTVALNTVLTHKVTVNNPLGIPRNVKVVFRADISQTAPYDLLESTSAEQNIAAGGSTTFSFPHTPTIAGNYSYSFEVLSQTSNYTKTDSSSWVSSFIASASVPTITGFTPASGVAGTPVTITGTNLSNATSVNFFYGIPAAISSNTATQITTTVPAGALTGPISVATAVGTATSTNNFIVPVNNVPVSRFEALDPLNGNEFGKLSPLAKLGTAGVSTRAFSGSASPQGLPVPAMFFYDINLPSVVGESFSEANFMDLSDPRFLLVFEGLRNAQVSYEPVKLSDFSAITWGANGRSVTVAVYFGSPLYSRIQEGTSTLRAVRIQKKEDGLIRADGADGTALSSGENIGVNNIVVVVHGWNPSGSANPLKSGTPLGNLMNSVREQLSASWGTFGYIWAKAAATGGKADYLLDPLAGANEKADSAGIRAAENGYLYGLDLAEELERRASLVVPTRIHFIAHSAGAWVVYSATRRLADRFPGSITFQITLLDPYMPANSKWSHQAPLGRDKWAFPSTGTNAFAKANIDLVENYYTEDISDSGTAGSFPWQDVSQIQANVSYDPQSPFWSLITNPLLGPVVDQWKNGHDYPIIFYSDSISRRYLEESVNGLDVNWSQIGWSQSMFERWGLLGPRVTGSPNSQSITVGSSVAFSVTATGSSPLTYQWRKNGANIAIASNPSAALATLILTDVQPAGAGIYDVVVTNDRGSDISQSATLAVNEPGQPPVIVTPPASRSAIRGEVVTLSVVATGAAPLGFQWLKNGDEISGAIGSQYIFNAGVQSSDAGTYTVRVSNAFGSVSNSLSPTVLTVNLPPDVTAQPTPTAQTVNVGSNVTYSVAANGTSPLSFQWRKNGSNYSGKTDATLALTNVQLNDSGNYSVKVSNPYGDDVSVTVKLTVTVPNLAPTITSGPPPDGTEGVSYGFQVTASGTQPITFAATNLPTGLSINSSTGIISGIPTVAGAASISLSANNGVNPQAVQATTLTITPNAGNADLLVGGNPSAGGTALGGGNYPVGSIQTITAMPNAGYHFTTWNDGNISQSRQVVVPAGGVTFTANFTPAPTIPAVPTGVSATDGIHSDKVVVSWTAADGAAAYDIYRSTIDDSATATMINQTEIIGTSFDDGSVDEITTYYYWVKATNGGLASNFSLGDAGYSGLPLYELIKDDFSGSLNDWTVMANDGEATWLAQSGALVGYYTIGNGSPGNSHSFLLLNDERQPGGNWAASVDFTLTNDPQFTNLKVSTASFGIWASDTAKLSITIGHSEWNWSVVPRSTAGVGVAFWNGTSWQQTGLDQTVNIAWDPTAWNKATIAKIGSVYRLFLNGVKLLEFTDTFLNGQGKLGLHTYGPQKLDNFTVFSSAAPPALRISGLGKNIWNGDSTPNLADGTNFGNATPGDIRSDISRTFSIINTGTGVLTLTGTPAVQLTGTNASDFSVTTEPASAISAGTGSNSTNFIIRFRPNGMGQRTATVTIASSDPATPNYTFSISGTGSLPIVAWGSNDYGESTVPAELGIIAGVAAGWYHNLAVTAGGNVVAWGYNNSGQCDVPAGLSDVVEIAAGYTHSLALKADGTVVAWGQNWSDQGTVSSGLTDVVAIASGHSNFLALKANGTVVAWGFNGSNVPTGLNNVVAIAAGSEFSLALRSDGTVVAWGSNNNGQCNVPAGLTDVVAIAAGQYHALALKADGTVVAWGASAFDNEGQVNVPVGLSNVVAIAAGRLFSVALKSDGSLVAWGAGYSGATGVPAGSGMVAVAANGYHGVALQSGAGFHGIRVVGDRAFGSLPVGSSTTRRLTIKNTGTSDLTISGITYPAGFSGNWSGTIPPAGFQNVTVTFTATATQVYGGVVTVNSNKTIGIDTITVMGEGAVSPATPINVSASDDEYADRIVVNWDPAVGATGYDVYRNTVADSAGATKINQSSISVTSYSDTTAVATTTYYYWVKATSGGLASEFSAGDTGYSRRTLLVSWGYGLTGLPDGLDDLVGITTGGAAYGGNPPFALALKSDGAVVGWGVPADLNNVIAIAAGEYNAMALKSDGTVVAWGTNSDGQLGINGLGGVVAISMGSFHSLALLSDGTVAAFGGNFAGQTNVPAGLSNVVSIAAGSYFSLALKSDGTVVAWGSKTFGPNASGQIDVPEGLSNVVAIAAGYSHAMALRSDGTVVVWGALTTVPEGLSNVVAIAAGDYHCLALKSDGSVVAWGTNSHAQTDVPAGLSNVVAIDAGMAESMALRSRTELRGIRIIGDLGFGSLPIGGSMTRTLSIVNTGSSPLAVSGINYPSGFSGNWVGVIPAGGFQNVTVTFSPMVAQSYTGTITVGSDATGGLNTLAPSGTGTAALPVAASFTLWQQGHFSAGELANAGLSGPNADPDSDGYRNLIEYALGLEPKAVSTTGMPGISVQGSDWVYTYTRPSDRTDLTYAVECSTNLTSWSSAGVTHELVSSSGGTETWRGRYPLASAANVFFRLRVTGQ